MSADHDVGAKGPNCFGGRSRVDAIPQRSPVRQLEWWIVRVVTPADQPWSGFDKGKVTVVVERAVNLVGRLEDVQPLQSIDFRGCPKTRLENTSCDVVTRADPGCEDQDSSTHGLMLGQPATKMSAQISIPAGPGPLLTVDHGLTRKPPRAGTGAPTIAPVSIRPVWWMSYQPK